MQIDSSKDWAETVQRWRINLDFRINPGHMYS